MKIYHLLFCLLIGSCAVPPPPIEIPSTEEFILADSLQIATVAAEPLLSNPVTMSFDLQGRIWIVELPGYMRDIEGNDEEVADGKIIVLSDENGDGVMDRRHVFLDNLVAPRAISLVYDGLLYTNGTALYFTTFGKDLELEITELVDSLYVVGGNIEHRPNGLMYHLDNWIYSAKSNARYRRRNGKWEKEVTTLRGQWGITHDEVGRLIYNDNSNPLLGDWIAPNQLLHNEFQQIEYNLNQEIVTNPVVFPYQATAVNRGYMEGVLDEEGKLIHFTSACAPLVYLGHVLPKEFYGNAFVCGPEVNLIKRYILSEAENGKITAIMPYDTTEFLISREETFRPVDLKHGIDGAMYILDMRRGVVQHHAYMSNYLRELVLEEQLDTVVDMGRIYRISKRKQKTDFPDLSQMSLSFFVGWLQHPSGYYRQLAQQQLVNKGDDQLLAPLTKIATDTENPLGQIHALWTLEGLNLLRAEHLERAASSLDGRVLRQIVQLTEFFPNIDYSRVYEQAAELNDMPLQLQLARTLGTRKEPIAEELWLQLAQRLADQPMFGEALVSGIAGKEKKYAQLLSNTNMQDSLGIIINSTLRNQRANRVQTPKLYQAVFEDNRTLGARLYGDFCESCHRPDGKGQKNLAPPLLNSEYLIGDSKNLIKILLHGLQGPLTIYGKPYKSNLVMPGLVNNPELTNADLAAIVIYIKNAFSETPARLSEETIDSIRQATVGRDSMFTEAELLAR